MARKLTREVRDALFLQQTVDTEYILENHGHVAGRAPAGARLGLFDSV